MSHPSSRPARSKEKLLHLFDEGHRLSYTAIREHLGIGERQARRLVKALQSEVSGLRIEWVGGVKQFWLAEEDRRASIDHVAFTETESLALAVAASAARAVLGTTPLAAPAHRAFKRLLDRLAPRLLHISLRDQPERWYIRAIAQTTFDADIFTTIVTGLNEQQSIRIEYGKPDAPPSHRKVNPLCLAVLDRAVLLTAWCCNDQDYRHFSLARIRKATLCDPASDPRPYFDRPDDFDPEVFYRPDVHGALTEGELQTFRILVEPEVAHLFHEREYRPLQLIEEERADGRLFVSYEGAGFEEWRSFFQSWGTKVTVLDPPGLRERLLADASELVRRYEASTDGA